MNNIKNLIRIIFGKAALTAALPFVFVLASVSAFAQTADVRYAGVFYKNNPTTLQEMYCNYASESTAGYSGETATADLGLTLSTMQQFSIDGSLRLRYVGWGTAAPSSPYVLRQPETAYQVGDRYYIPFAYSSTLTLYARYVVIGFLSDGFSIAVAEGEDEAGKGPNRSWVYAPQPTSASHPNEPWVSSALIEYDQPYPESTNPKTNEYPNHCLSLCMSVKCSNKPIGGSTYSISFPLQQIKFDVVKYYQNKNVENPEETPAIRTIDLYPNEEAARCGSYRCPGKSESAWTCNSATYYCNTKETITGSGDSATATCANNCYRFSDGVKENSCSCTNGVCNFAVWNHDGTTSNGTDSIPFCAAWDGSYEIAGEFGKTNGTFAYRASVITNVPGDSIIVDKIDFNSTIAYPGMNQAPIKVDVTDIHTVRSTPSVVGNITAVAAQPYTYSYRLSKDADVRIAVFDASTDDNAAYDDFTTVKYSCSATDGTYTTSTTCEAAGYTWGTWYTSATDTNPTTACCTVTPVSLTDIVQSDVVRTLADWQPRLGEGMKGVDKDVQITEFDSWDGRNDQGMLLPAGNYVVSLQAKSQDEWPGIDFSRAVTRQLSLDPLKLTDVVVSGLTKQSTAYASIAYTPTESAKVYWNIYTPGTTVDNVLTNSAAQTGTAPTVTGGTLVYSLIEDRVGRMNFTSKWDGLCGMDGTQAFTVANGANYPAEAVDNNGNPLTGTCGTAGGCTYYMNKCSRDYAFGEKMSNGTVCSATAPQYTGSGNLCRETFAYGSPMPDGNYVYVLWAEIPYNGCYYNKASGWTDGVHNAPYFVAGQPCDTANYPNTQAFSGVKTLKYNTGEIAIERGVVDITIQPVSYSTVGSSPTAYGLDPFIFKYSIARDSTVVAKVTNTAGLDVKYLTPREGVTQVAQQMNTISWDGRDDAGRMVTPGTYMFVVETKDAMFPAVTNRASAVFPVDMYRVVDLATTDVYGDSDAKATLSYSLSKAMNVQVNIYNKDVIIPNYQTGTGNYDGDITVTNSTTFTGYTGEMGTNGTMCTGANCTWDPNNNIYTGTNVNSDLAAVTTYFSLGTMTYMTATHRYTVTVQLNPGYVENSTVWNELQYLVTVVNETITTSSNAAVWPPRVCNVYDDGSFFTGNYVDPSKNPTCIYVNDTSFQNYPANAAAVAAGNYSVRLKPVKTFERSSLKPGDGLQITEEWDALYFNNPNKCANTATDMSTCPYEMVPDGQYPFYVSARSNEGFTRYYALGGENINNDAANGTYLTGAPYKYTGDITHPDSLYATDKVTGKINVTRGAVYFLDGSTVVYPNAPQLFNVSSGPVFVPPYEINFSVSRASTVEIAIVALQPGVCNPDPTVHQDLKNNIAGDVCKYLSTMTVVNTGGVFDPNIVRKTYWDGTDNNGFYVKPAAYEVRLTARNYPNPDLYEPTVKKITVNADLLKVFDLLEADGYAISQRGTNMTIGYQISVPMKVAIQIFKPGTTIYDYQKGTLRNPTTGTEVQDIHEVLVKSIVGIRPATTLIEEIWDGTDYAGQEVPDGTYPFRFVTALNSADIDSVTGEIMGDWAQTDGQANSHLWKINKVADTYEYQNLHKATIAIGDGKFVCEDWEKTVFFYPNPLTDASKGTLEITKMPVPGEVSIKFFNLAGDLVRDSNYTCVDANNYQVTMGSSLAFQPDNNVSTTVVNLNDFENIRNAALRCRWDRTNQHGKKVARGVYFGLVDFKARMGREHCQKVVKVLIP